MKRISIACFGAVLILGACKADSTAPGEIWEADLRATVRTPAGVPVAGTTVLISCPATTTIASATTNSSGVYAAAIEISKSLLSSKNEVTCKVDAPNVPSGAISKTALIQFYPPATPHPLQGVDLP